MYEQVRWVMPHAVSQSIRWSSTNSRISSAMAIEGCVSFSCAAHDASNSRSGRRRITCSRIMSWREQETKKYCCDSRSSLPASGSSFG